MSSTPRSFTEPSEDPSRYASLVTDAANAERSRIEMALSAYRTRAATLASIRYGRRSSNPEAAIRQIIADETKEFYASISEQKPESPSSSVEVRPELKGIRAENHASRGLVNVAPRVEGTGRRPISATVYQHGPRAYAVGAYRRDPSRRDSIILRPEAQFHVPRRRVAPKRDYNGVVNLRPWAAAESRRRPEEGLSRRPPLSSKSLRILEHLIQVREDNRSLSVRKRRLPPMPVPPSIIKKARLSQNFKVPEVSVRRPVTHLEESRASSMDARGQTDPDFDVNVNTSRPSRIRRRRWIPRKRERYLEGRLEDLYDEPCSNKQKCEGGRSIKFRGLSDSVFNVNVKTSLPLWTGRGQSHPRKRKTVLEEPGIRKQKFEDGREKKRSRIACRPRNAMKSASKINKGFGFTLAPAIPRTQPVMEISNVDNEVDSGARGKRQCTQCDESQSLPAPSPVCIQKASVKTTAVPTGKRVGRGSSQVNRDASISGRMSALEETDYKVADNSRQDNRCNKSQSPPAASVVSVERPSLNVAMVSKSTNGESILPVVNAGLSRSEILFAHPVPDSEPPANPQRNPDNTDDIKGGRVLPVVNVGPSRSELMLARPLPDSEPPVMPRRDSHNAEDPMREGQCGTNSQDVPAPSPVSVQRASRKPDTTSQKKKKSHRRRRGRKLVRFKDSVWADINKHLNG